MTEPIYHLAFADHWEQAQQSGVYTQSTRGRTLQDEGFIHCSYADQYEVVAANFYADVNEPLVLLTIDPARVGPEIRPEPPAPGAPDYPHIYGPLNIDAVVAVREFRVS